MKKIRTISLIIILSLLLFTLFGCNQEVKGFETKGLDPSTLDLDNTAHVIFLCGQSNATGCSYVQYLEANSTKEQFEEYENGYDNVYINVYNEETKTTNDTFIQCRVGLGYTTSCFGPELGLAKYLHDNYPNETFFIIKRSYGGSFLDSQWLDSSTGNKNTIYNQFETFAKASLKTLDNMNIKYQVEAFLWMQGESDTLNDLYLKYYDNTVRLANYVRSDFKDVAQDNGIFFIDAGITNVWSDYEKINAAKKQFANESKLNYYFSTTENGLTTNQEPISNPELAHYDSISEIKLGELFAKYYEISCLIK